MIYDAKYKEELSRKDVVELLTYIAELTTPIEVRGRRAPSIKGRSQGPRP